MITAALLVDACGARRADAERAAPHLADACRDWEIVTPNQIAAFLGQLVVESGAFRHSVELWGPTPAQGSYEGRADLGNNEPGDGFRYRGRGWLQVTGRANYWRLTARVRVRFGHGPDFEQYPDMLAEPNWSAQSAAEWWDRHGCNRLADAWEIPRLSRLVNRGNADAAAPANHEAQRIAATEKVRAALTLRFPPLDPLPAQTPDPVPEPTLVQLGPESSEPPDQPAGVTEEWPRTIMAPFLAAALPALIEMIPRLGRVFGSGSAVAERNVKAAEVVAPVVQKATAQPTIQGAVEAMRADPAVLQTAVQAVESRWLDITESGGGGIEGARRADAAGRAAGDLLHSASFWVALLLLPLVYILVLSLVGLIGSATWSDDVRAGLAGSLISAIVGGLVGYYYGQTTSRNRAAGSSNPG